MTSLNQFNMRLYFESLMIVIMGAVLHHFTYLNLMLSLLIAFIALIIIEVVYEIKFKK